MGVVAGVALTGSVVILLLLLHDVASTALLPRPRPGWSTRLATRAAGGPTRALAARLAPAARERVFELGGTAVVLIVTLCWLVMAAAAAVLVATACHPADPPAAIEAMAGGSRGDPVTGSGLAAGLWWFSAGVVVLASGVLLRRITLAYEARESLVRARLPQTVRPLLAESVLLEMLRTDSLHQLDGFLEHWLPWMNDLCESHCLFPSLLLHRPTRPVSWLEAAVVVLDLAALCEAVARASTAPHARPVLHAGIECLHHLSESLGGLGAKGLPEPVVSSEWREEVDFAVVLRTLADAGLPSMHDTPTSFAIFQSWRTQYAPHAVNLATHLLYDDAVATAPASAASGGKT